jgi:diguanylate cyclase (GGDEF)-like protein
MDRLAWVIDRVRRFGEMHSVLFLDLDRFKEINDTFGHGGGDEFLIQAASRLRVSVRDVDFVTRISGDEFAIILSGAGGSETVADVAERIQRNFGIPFRIQEHSVPGSVTIGIAMLPADGTDAETILQKADEALYAAKRNQRGTYRFCGLQDDEKIAHRNILLRELKKAIAHETFHLEFQPTMDVDNGLTTGFEALLRWNHPELGLVAAAEFIPLAEEAGLIHELGEWVIRKAIDEAATWPEHLRVAINVSSVQFRTLEIPALIERCIGKTDISADRIEIEVTESMILADIERANVALSKLRQIGVRIALDDFGKGYSSLVHLIRLPIDRIKIDQFFVGQLETSDECKKMVRAIVRLARELKINATAEGVETEAQLSFLKSAGCREAQGYFISHPVRDVRNSGLTTSCYPAASRRTAA